MYILNINIFAVYCTFGKLSCRLSALKYGNLHTYNEICDDYFSQISLMFNFKEVMIRFMTLAILISI